MCIAFVCPLCSFFASCVCSLLFYMSICVAMVDAHKVDKGQRMCPRFMVVLPKLCLFGQFSFFLLITRVSIFKWAEGVSSVNGCFNQNSVCLGSCFLSSRIIRVSIFIGLRMYPRLMVALTQTLFLWAVCFILLDHEDKWF